MMKFKFKITNQDIKFTKNIEVTAENLAFAYNILRNMYPCEQGYKHELCD